MNSSEVQKLADSLGANAADLVQRLQFREGVALAIALDVVGFRGGWVSSAQITSGLHPKHWAAVLESMGYVLHPAVKGRTQLLKGEGRTRLFIKTDHEHRDVTKEKNAVRFYQSAQT